MKKIILLCLMALLFLGNGFANGKEEQKGESSLQVSPTGVYPIVQEKVSISVFVPKTSKVKDFTTNDMTEYMEEYTNVHLEWDVAPDISAARVMIASGDFPDLMVGALTFTDAMLYGDQGLLLELNEYIDEYSVNLKEILNNNPKVNRAIETPDGKKYVFPRITTQNHSHIMFKFWNNKVWRENLGIEIPKTTEEFHQMLLAFKNDDPNGNGIADELPLTGSIEQTNSMVLPFLMNAFILDDGEKRLILRKGAVKSAANQPEWREGLRYINQLYSDGLIDPAAFTQDLSQMRGLAEQGDINILGGFPAMHVRMGWQLNTRADDGEVLLPLTGPEGYNSTYIGGIPAEEIAPGISLQVRPNLSVNADTEYPEVITKWVDFLYSQEGSMRAMHGVPEVNWTSAESGSTNVIGLPATWAPVDTELKNTSDWTQNNNWHQVFPVFDNEIVRLGASQSGYSYEGFLYQNTIPYMPFVTDEQYPYYGLPLPGDVEEVSQIEGVIVDFITESAIRFITGDRSIDGEWDIYVDELNNLGLPRLLEIYQKAYDQQYK